jgi:hypothetical protein
MVSMAKRKVMRDLSDVLDQLDIPAGGIEQDELSDVLSGRGHSGHSRS